MPSESKSWLYRYTFNGKRYKMSLGKYPEISLKEARDLLFKAQKLKENGVNPLEQNYQDKLKQKETVSTFINAWYKNYIEKHRKTTSAN